MLMGGSPLAELVGILAGHFYFFFEDIIPRTHGYRLLKTPQFMYCYPSLPPCPNPTPDDDGVACRTDGRYRLVPPEYNSYNRGQQQQQARRGATFTGTGYSLRG